MTRNTELSAGINRTETFCETPNIDRLAEQTTLEQSSPKPNNRALDLICALVGLALLILALTYFFWRTREQNRIYPEWDMACYFYQAYELYLDQQHGHWREFISHTMAMTFYPPLYPVLLSLVPYRWAVAATGRPVQSGPIRPDGAGGLQAGARAQRPGLSSSHAVVSACQSTVSLVCKLGDNESRGDAFRPVSGGCPGRLSRD